MQLQASEKLIDPPIFAEESAIIGDLDLRAASLSVVRDIEGIRPFGTQGQISISDHMVTQLQDGVRNYFFSDQLNYPSPQPQPMTATEAQIRYELMQRLLGPTLGRLQNDLLDPVVGRAFRMLAREGMLEEPPQVVLDSDADMDIEYLGALTRAQRTDRAASIERLVANVGQMAPVLPEMLDTLDPNEVVRSLAMDLNVPATILRDEADVEQMQTERNEKQAVAEEAMLAQAEGEAQQAQQGAEA
jgi:hypothetical protein